MKKILTLAAAFTLFATSQAFALAGAGAHYILNTGSLSSNTGILKYENNGELYSVTIAQKKNTDLFQGLGFKGWIDFLPLIDIEGTFNIVGARYGTDLILATPTSKTTMPMTFTPDAPYNMIFDKASPMFGMFNADISVTVPMTSLFMIRPYAGVGGTFFGSVPIVDTELLGKVLSDPQLVAALTGTEGGDAAKEVGQRLSKALKEESYTAGMGGHIIFGFRIKYPWIFAPPTLYCNGKYYFGGNLPKQFTNGFVLEAGLGLAL